MVLSYGGWLVVLGILGASNLIIAKKPNAKELIDKFSPHQDGSAHCRYSTVYGSCSTPSAASG